MIKLSSGKTAPPGFGRISLAHPNPFLQLYRAFLFVGIGGGLLQFLDAITQVVIAQVLWNIAARHCSSIGSE